MKIISDVSEMQKHSLNLRRQGKVIGLVPTMGFLHEGHLSLVDLAREKADVVVISIYVNPIQFGPCEDFHRYPRDFGRDARVCRNRGVDIVFAPDNSSMYAAGHSVYVNEERLSTGLCGAHRPGHFKGVATVVAKLFNIVQPDIAVFGQKDAQQVRVIEQMVRDLNFPVRIDVAPTVRDPDGLAMSSRNKYLSSGERTSALCLSKALMMAEREIANGATDGISLTKKIRGIAGGAPWVRLEYAEIVDYTNLRPMRKIRRPVLVALAARVGKTRLIDNVVIRR
jgi:pantoate--beta-alanine ligase